MIGAILPERSLAAVRCSSWRGPIGWPGGHPPWARGSGTLEVVDTRVLIDSIMRQTTVLIAQLSSAAGVRAPLAHVADEVFLHLSQELEQQGVSRKVVADMFGLALRGYQRRVQRLSESATERGKTLWQALLELVQNEGPVSRRRVFERFQYDDPAAVGAVLNDLTSSGLVHRTGSGNETIYGLTQDRERAALARASTLETASSLVWLELCRAPTASVDQLAAQLALSAEKVEAALERLEAEGRVHREQGHLSVDPMVVPVGATAGWEAAVFDHFQTMCVALASKLRDGAPRSRASDTTGGATLSFEIHEAHPERDAVRGLLARVRAEANDLWQRVEAYNAEHPCPEGMRRVRFYVGQVEAPAEDDS